MSQPPEIPTIPAMETIMTTIFSGLKNQGVSWTGYSNGSVTLKNASLVNPQSGTNTAKFNLLSMDKQYPNSNIFVVMYTNINVSVILIGAEYSDSTLATTTACQKISQDIATGTVLVSNQ